MKKVLTALLVLALLLGLCLPLAGEEKGVPAPTALDGDGEKELPEAVQTAHDLGIRAVSAVLMEEKTGKILYAQNENAALPPASITKVMTLLLVMEAIDAGKIAWDGIVTASERAASMGGSQIYLKVGEQMTVEDLVKSVVIASANDAALALAEYVAGSEEAFVAAMNRRAAELGMTSTHFENTNGLDDTVENHVTSAKDIAIMSRALMSHPKILDYSSIWMDSVREGAFTLTNTNRLVRFYPGATGLKTGSTAKAKFCISATAKRDGLSLIAVIMGAETRDIRNAEAKKLLDYGFANFAAYEDHARTFVPLAVKGGTADSMPLCYAGFTAVLPKEKCGSVKAEVTLPEYVRAPLKLGDAVGEVRYTLDGEEIGRVPVCAAATVSFLSYPTLLKRMISVFTLR